MSVNIAVEKEHGIPQEDVYGQIDKLFDQLAEQHPDLITHPKKNWNKDHSIMSYSVSVKGYDFNGYVYVCDRKVRVEGDIPTLVAMFGKDEIKAAINGKLDELLQPD